jgi:predicted nucleotidyltransferase
MTTAAEPAWQITADKVRVVVRRLIEVARSTKISLFGFYVRGEATRDTDLDALVIASQDLRSPSRESVRLRNSLSHNPPLSTRNCTPASLKLRDSKNQNHQPADVNDFKEAQARFCPHRSATGTNRLPALEVKPPMKPNPTENDQQCEMVHR